MSWGFGYGSSEREFMMRYGELQARWEAGMVRDCHGDLHLGNIVLLGGELIPFDCIEFNAGLRWNDVVSEAAFLTMDLIDRGAPGLAWLFLNAYLESTGDYGGLSVLRFYLVYYAMVRANMHLLRARQGIRGERRRTTPASRLPQLREAGPMRGRTVSGCADTDARIFGLG